MRSRVLGLLSLCSTFTLVTACKPGASQDDGADSTGEDGGSSPSGGDDDGATEGGSAAEAGDDAADSGDDGSDEAGDDGASDEPHARGTITLGESHLPQSANSSPIVAATFVPDYHDQPATCGTDVAGCFVQTLPDCAGQCELDEFCTFNTDCASTCQRVCDLPCGDDEVCYFPVPDNPACKRIEYFDAGALNFTGTTVPVTLFPPYAFQGDVTGALYLPSSEVSVHATGATEAGFESFEQTFMTTTYMDATIEDLGLEEIYGAGPLPVSWVAGGDDVRVTATVTGLSTAYGIITCNADDGAGSFDFPREAIAAALPDDQLAGISLAIERRRSEIHKGFATTGALLEHTVQPQGWLEIVSTSVESVTLTGCGNLAYCDGACIDVQFDANNCGGCGDACAADSYCEYGECRCEGGLVECGGDCVDTFDNDDHCGQCGNACDANEACMFGGCVPQEPDPTDDGGEGGEGGGDVGNCCSAHAGGGCTADPIEQCVCAEDPFCCNTEWDGTCVNEVESLGCGMC